MKLSPTMTEALTRCVANGRLEYVLGDYWVESPKDFVAAQERGETLWNATANTIEALFVRRLVAIIGSADGTLKAEPTDRGRKAVRK